MSKKRKKGKKGKQRALLARLFKGRSSRQGKETRCDGRPVGALLARLFKGRKNKHTVGKRVWRTQRKDGKNGKQRALLARLFKGRKGKHGKETGVGGGQKCSKAQCN